MKNGYLTCLAVTFPPQLISLESRWLILTQENDKMYMGFIVGIDEIHDPSNACDLDVFYLAAVYIMLITN